jgi:hypothetical protein
VAGATWPAEGVAATSAPGAPPPQAASLDFHAPKFP